MTDYGSSRKPSQFRLPQWVAEYVEERSAAMGSTKTDVIVEAVSCLRDREVRELMAEGYREMSETGVRTAEEGIGASGEDVPEW